jgi:antitoxin component HigA of HigAB toxin-antitoxin module
MLNEQTNPTTKFDAREQGWSPRKPDCLGKISMLVFGNEKWYKCGLTVPDLEDDLPTKESENELDKKVEEFEEKIQEVKTSETYRRALEELNSLVDNVKNSTVTATEKVKLQYNLWVLRNKLEEKNPTSKPQSVRNDLSQTYKSCTGFNQLGCKSESIKKVQECLGLEPTGNFDNLMYNKLGNYGWQNGFNDSDVNRVCDLIKKTIEMNIQIEKQKKETEDFYRKFPKTSRGSEILDLS